MYEVSGFVLGARTISSVMVTVEPVPVSVALVLDQLDTPPFVSLRMAWAAAPVMLVTAVMPLGAVVRVWVILPAPVNPMTQELPLVLSPIGESAGQFTVAVVELAELLWASRSVLPEDAA